MPLNVRFKKSKNPTKVAKQFTLQKLKVLYCVLFGVITIVLILFLNNSFLRLPALGKFLSPQHGVWQNIEKVKMNGVQKIELKSQNIKNGKILLDLRSVPHIFTHDDNDAYFLQGYLHAKYRLWQMDFYTYLVSGRLSEIVGKRGVESDVFFRKIQIVEYAQNMLREMESDPSTKSICDNYTAGVNEYINQLKYSKYPIEYKVYSYKPEPWTNLKSALLLKLMAIDKTGFNEDLKKTFLAKNFGKTLYQLLYPTISTIDVPTFNSTQDFDVIEKPLKNIEGNTKMTDSFFYDKHKESFFTEGYQPQNEINAASWVLSPKKSKTNNAIHCNTLSSFFTMPNLVFEMQIKTQQQNVYGISYPGIPCILIGFNSHCAWGLNTPNVDVKDYFNIKFKDQNHQQFLFNQKWHNIVAKEELIKVRNGVDVKIRCLQTILGPVLHEYDNEEGAFGYVQKWTIQETSNELKAFYLLNKMNDYSDFKRAVQYLESPVYNVTYSDLNGNIALHLEGKIPAHSEFGGDFVFPATDSFFLWNYCIPKIEKPFLFNPASEFVFSNNQMLFYPANYPYYLGSTFNGLSSKRIYDFINNKEKLGIKEMMFLQNENYSSFAETLVPLLLEYVPQESVDSKSLKHLKILQNWNFRYDSEEEAPTIFETWIAEIQKLLLEDELSQFKELKNYTIPPIALIQMLQNTDVPNPLVDNITTPEEEKWNFIITEAFKKITPKLIHLNKSKKLEWSYFKNVSLSHPLNMNSMSVKNIVAFGGGDKILTNINPNYGASCKMIVQHTSPIEAYISVAGGQSGNAGSVFYKSSLPKWLNGEYDKIIFLISPKQTDDILSQIQISNNEEKKGFWSFFNFNL